MARFSAALPSITALRAFESAARQLSFTAAAAELSLTQSAVSHQIRGLEDLLDTSLFERKAGGIALTASGELYLGFVTDTLENLVRGSRAVSREVNEGMITVTCSPNFAQKWLVPRLGDFYSVHPDIDLRLSASMKHVDLQKDGIDIAVRHGNGKWPGFTVTKLCDETVFPVCSPHLLKDGEKTLALSELADWQLIHDHQREGWTEWLKDVGENPANYPLDSGPVFNHSSLAIDAAIAMQGVALARSALVELDLKANRLVRPVARETAAKFGYWIVHEKSRASDSVLAAFKQWLLDQLNPKLPQLDGDEKHPN